MQSHRDEEIEQIKTYLSKEAAKNYLVEILNAEINLAKLYRIEEVEEDVFYLNSKRYRNFKKVLSEIESKEPGMPPVLRVKGILKFIKQKYEEVLSQVSSLTKFSKMPVSSQRNALKELQKFVKSFRFENERVMFSLFQCLIPLMEVVFKKGFKDMFKEEAQLLNEYIESCKLFCFKFAYDSLTTELKREREFRELLPEVDDSYREFMHYFFLKFWDKAEYVLADLGDPKVKNQLLGGGKEGGAPIRLKCFNNCLNLTCNLAVEQFKPILAENREFEKLVENSFSAFLRAQENLDRFVGGSKSQEKYLHDFLFFSLTLFSTSIDILDDLVQTYVTEKDRLLKLMVKNFEDMGYRTLEVFVVLLLTNSGTEVRMAMTDIGKYQEIMRYEKQGYRMGLERTVRRNDLSDFLVKVRELKDMFSEYVKRIFENYQPSYFKLEGE